MTDAKRLKEKLGKLASGDDVVSAEGRVLHATDMQAAILVEIDETMLPRLLTFTRPDGESLALEVSGRRLLRIVSAPATTAGPDGIGPLTEPLVADSPDQLARVAQCLAAFGQGAASVTVRTERLERRPDPSNVGRSAAAIAAAAGTDLLAGPGDVGTTMDAASTTDGGGLDDLAEAAARLADGGIAPLDAGPAPGPLANVPAAALQRVLSELPPGDKACLCLRSTDDGPALVVVRLSDEVRLYLVPSDRLSDALALTRPGAGI